MQLLHVFIAAKSPFEVAYALLSSFMMDPSFGSPSTKLLFSICSIAVLLLAPAAHWYLTWRVKLPFPVAGTGAKANNVEAMEEAKSKVSRPTLRYALWDA